MIGTFLLLWILSLVFFGSMLLQLIASSRTPLEFGLLLAYSMMLIIFWTIAAYCVAVGIFSILSKPLPFIPMNSNKKNDDVAILYLVCNDFQTEAASSCLKQNYPNFHLFLLDDSTKKESRATVDTFHEAHPDKTTVVRRATRRGFKAGNLNHAISTAAAKYSFFAVVDADEKLPPNFLRRTIPYFQDSDIAFVQANHEPNPNQDSPFAKDISPTLLSFWHIYRPRNRYGFVVFLGHGAVIRRSAWEMVGGFPEVATEDLAFSVVLGERGMRGVFIEDLICYEDFAEDYVAFKRQQERYIIGTTEVIDKYLGSMLRSTRISLAEKIDSVMWCLLMYLPPLVFLFLVLSIFGIAITFGNWQSSTLTVMGHEFVIPVIRALDEPFRVFQSKSFQIFSTVCVISPAFPAFVLSARRKLNVIKLLSLNTVPYFSLMIVSWRAILGYLFKRRVIWGVTTGEHATQEKYSRDKCFNSLHPLIFLEIVIGILLAIASLILLNFAFFAVSSCLLIGAFIHTFGWKNRFVRIASIFCFALIILQLLINVVSPFQPQLIMPLPFPMHL